MENLTELKFANLCEALSDEKKHSEMLYAKCIELAREVGELEGQLLSLGITPRTKKRAKIISLIS